MANPVRVTIKGSNTEGTDAPSVEDLIGQVKDFVEVLQGVERAMAGGSNDLVWRVTDARMNSPIGIELTPFAKDSATYIGARAVAVERATSEGFRALRQGARRPPYFTDEVLQSARRMHARVNVGLSTTTVDFSEAVDPQPVVIDRSAAAATIAAQTDEKVAAEFAYRELGSIEGFAAKAERDGHGRPILWFRARLDNVLIKAIGRGEAFQQLESLHLSDVWGGVRLRVYGTLHYKTLGVIDYVAATSIELFGSEALPDLDDILDPEFTGDLTSEEYLSELRNG
jgi:hypothetical protein